MGSDHTFTVRGARAEGAVRSAVEALAVQRAIEDTTGNGIRTADVGGNATTAEVTAAIIESLAN